MPTVEVDPYQNEDDKNRTRAIWDLAKLFEVSFAQAKVIKIIEEEYGFYELGNCPMFGCGGKLKRTFKPKKGGHYIECSRAECNFELHDIWSKKLE